MRGGTDGLWTSPITAAEVAAERSRAEFPDFVGDELWWVENRPAENGRGALVRRTADGALTEVLAPRWNVRNRVMEYGGRPWVWLGDARVAFTHWDDQRVYHADADGTVRPLSPVPDQPAGCRYADLSRVGGEVWCVRESITGPTPTDVRRALVALPLDGSAAEAPERVRVLAETHHFLTGPKVSPDGEHVVWIGWDHPGMPWDGTEVMCAPLLAGPDGAVPGPARRIAGDAHTSVCQVEWAPDRPDTVLLMSDPDGWWNLHEVTLDGRGRSLCPRAEEFGGPLWQPGTRWFLPLTGGGVFVTRGIGMDVPAVLDPDGTLRDLGGPYSEWTWPATDGTRIAAVAGSPRHDREVVLVDPERGLIESVRPVPVRHAAYVSTGSRRTFHGPDGVETHAHVYPPHHPDHSTTGPAPYLVVAHGGPTGRSRLVVNQEIAYFTSRGIGVVDVQYGGSTGYGRAYRERLRGNWGVVDVRDCATVIRALIAEGLADPERVGVRGGSAGGWTAVASLAAEPGLYRAAGVYYPVLDPLRWQEDGAHDFESRYLESLIGPWPRARARYEEVSPLERAEAIRAPFVLFQGLEDPVCRPAQARRLLDRIRGRGIPHAYLTFAGEGHGFRSAETIAACLTAELALYARVFGLAGPDTPTIDLVT